MCELTKRELMLSAAAGWALGGTAHAQSRKLTAGDVVDRIKGNLGVPWRDTAYRDTFKIAGPEAPVAGICTTFGTNLLLMQKAQKAGLNMIITHEPTFWSDADTVSLVENDPIYKLKLDFAKRHNMVVWRIHDHWHAVRPDGIQRGFTAALGWKPYEIPSDRPRYQIPATTLGDLARYIAKVLDTRSIRVIGDPALPVTKVAYGSHNLRGNMIAFPWSDCLVVSEAREYDTFEYIRDTLATGARKGAIIISHVSGEDEGMNEFARWLKPLITEVPVRYIPTTDEFWTV